MNGVGGVGGGVGGAVVDPSSAAYQQGDGSSLVNQPFYNAVGGAGDDDLKNARTFYLSPHDFLNDVYNQLTGRIDGGDERDEDAAVMSDRAASAIIRFIRPFVDKIVLLTNFDRDTIRKKAWNAVNPFDSWLFTDGWQKHNIPLEEAPKISVQMDSIIDAALHWAQNGGGRYWITTTTTSRESYVMNGSMMQQDGGGGYYGGQAPAPPRRGGGGGGGFFGKLFGGGRRRGGGGGEYLGW